MITPTHSQSGLTLIFANTNRALAAAIQNATPEQLERLQEGKDPQSLLSSLFGDKLTSAKSDQTLLEILKNAPVFSTLGRFDDNVRQLLSQLQASDAFSGKTGWLESFLQSVDAQDATALKTQMEQSGVFLEGKIAAALQTLPTLTRTLETLASLLENSALSGASDVAKQIRTLLDFPTMSDAVANPQSAQTLSDSLRTLVDAYRAIRTQSDPLYSPQMARGIDELSRLAADTPVSSLSSAVKPVLSELYGLLLSSKLPDASILLDGIETFLNAKGAATADPTERLGRLIDTLRMSYETPDPALSAPASALVSKLAENLRPSDLLLEETFRSATENDLKAHLLRLSDDLSTRPGPPNADLLDPVNRLLTQIDYHQLLSHLSASNSVYFPFAWDRLEEGHVSFKKGREKKFFCEINLTLKEYGKLDVMMALFDDTQVELQAQSERQELRELIEAHLPELRSLLIDAGLTPRRLRITRSGDSHRSVADAYDAPHPSGDFGFEAKA